MGLKQTAQLVLNKCMPAASRIKLGDLLVDLITRCNHLRTRVNSGLLSSAGLAIKAGGSAVVKAATAFSAVVSGAIVVKAANTDMPALAGTLATAKSAVWAFYIDAAGTLSVSAKTADAANVAAALALFPATPDDKALVGFVVISNATGSDFVGGTTALDTSSLTVSYYSCVGPTPFVSAALKDLESR